MSGRGAHTEENIPSQQPMVVFIHIHENTMVNTSAMSEGDIHPLPLPNPLKSYKI